MSFIRGYHFLPSRHALDNIRHRRLKIALLNELNDPFELWAIAQPDHKLRMAIRLTKDAMAKEHGLICFSLSWRNPLLWSHYAEKHRGIALGFDISAELLRSVTYVKDRPVLKELNLELAQWLLFTKYDGWSYEEEARIFTTLEERDSETGLYFINFNQQVILREVIAGPLCATTKQEISQALLGIEGVALSKSRLAFNSFDVVLDQRGLG